MSNIKLNGHLLTPVKSVTYLGIETDETLSWNNQIEALAKKLSRTNGILSKLIYYIPTETLTQYTTAFFSRTFCMVQQFGATHLKKIL